MEGIVGNCLDCENNVLGECQLCGKEISYYYVRCKSVERPKWCLKRKGE